MRNSEAEIAWAAGLFDGEGSITIHGSSVTLMVSMTDRDLVERLARVMGAGGVCTHKRPGMKRLYTWSLTKRVEVQRVLTELLPWFGERRTARATEALSLIATFYRICGAKGCDVEFLAARSERVYCSPNCYQRTHRAQARQRYHDNLVVV